MSDRGVSRPGESRPRRRGRGALPHRSPAIQCSDGGAKESIPQENVIALSVNGPLYVRGDIHITGPLGDTLLEDTRVALCRCGESRTKPLCDNTHKQTNFRDEGILGR